MKVKINYEVADNLDIIKKEITGETKDIIIYAAYLLKEQLEKVNEYEKDLYKSVLIEMISEY